MLLMNEQSYEGGLVNMKRIVPILTFLYAAALAVPAMTNAATTAKRPATAVT